MSSSVQSMAVFLYPILKPLRINEACVVRKCSWFAGVFKWFFLKQKLASIRLKSLIKPLINYRQKQPFHSFSGGICSKVTFLLAEQRQQENTLTAGTSTFERGDQGPF